VNLAPVFLRVADITTGMTGRLDGPPLLVDEATTPFLVDGGPPDVTVEVGWGDLSGAKDGETLFDSGGVWRLCRRADRLEYSFRSAAFGDTPYKTASFDAHLTTGEVRLHRPYFETLGPGYPLAYPLDELLMIGLLGQGRGIEIHGCGILDRSGEGYLFVGQSGAGKTTMARLWIEEGGATVLSDDRLVLRSQGDRIQMYGTPWHGEAPLASPRSVPLSHIFFLRHAAAHALVPVKRADAAAQLFASSFPPFHSPTALEFTLNMLERIVCHVPSDRLCFAPDQTVIDLIRRQAA
jgi:hypothetical protein